MSEVLSYKNASIRKITPQDTENIVKWRNSPSVNKHFIYREPFTYESHLNWYNNKILKGEVVQFIITDNQTGKDIGSVYLRDIDNINRKCEYGIFIGEDDCRGKGIGSAAAKLAVDYAFRELDMNRVFLRVFADNPRAIKSYENAGFKIEGTFRDDVIIDGKAYDMVFMSILRKDIEKEV